KNALYSLLYLLMFAIAAINKLTIINPAGTPIYALFGKFGTIDIIPVVTTKGIAYNIIFTDFHNPSFCISLIVSVNSPSPVIKENSFTNNNSSALQYYLISHLLYSYLI